MLKGSSAVMHLMVNNERDICICIGLDKNVSLFSLKDQTLGKSAVSGVLGCTQMCLFVLQST